MEGGVTIQGGVALTDDSTAGEAPPPEARLQRRGLDRQASQENRDAGDDSTPDGEPQLLARGVLEFATGVQVVVPCLDDLTATKRIATRPKDAEDIRSSRACATRGALEGNDGRKVGEKAAVHGRSARPGAKAFGASPDARGAGCLRQPAHVHRRARGHHGDARRVQAALPNPCRAARPSPAGPCPLGPQPERDGVLRTTAPETSARRDGERRRGRRCHRSPSSRRRGDGGCQASSSIATQP